VQCTRKAQCQIEVTPSSVERQVRQTLAQKVSGTLLGIWLLVAEDLRLGTWDLVRSWSGQTSAEALPPRLALHLIHEAALCRPSLRWERSLRHKGFELANGLPFLPTDAAIHELLNGHTCQEAYQLQTRLGQLRRASGHLPGRLLALDAHRLLSYSQRDMVQRRPKASAPPTKLSQSLFLLDAESGQPACLVLASSARTAPQASVQLLQLAGDILGPNLSAPPLMVADVELYSAEMLDLVRTVPGWDLLVPMRSTPQLQQQYRQIPPERFTPHWAGFATAQDTFQPRGSTLVQPCYRYIQRTGERPEEYHFKAFACTGFRSEVLALTQDFPARWHIEEFFRFDQDLGWNRAGTLNLNIRLGQMSLALVAQTLIHQLRQRLGPPFRQWDSPHFARDFFSGLDGDLRVAGDTIVVTYYNVPDAPVWKHHFEGLPAQLERENVNPHVPWLYDFKLDFQFK
jgi:hypothetical protein